MALDELDEVESPLLDVRDVADDGLKARVVQRPAQKTYRIATRVENGNDGNGSRLGHARGPLFASRDCPVGAPMKSPQPSVSGRDWPGSERFAPVSRMTLPESSPRATSPTSASEPGGHEPAAIVIAQVGRKVPHVGFPRRDDATRRPVEVVDLLGEIALDVPNDLPSLRGVERPALQPDHVGQLRVVHARRVGLLIREI